MVLTTWPSPLCAHPLRCSPHSQWLSYLCDFAAVVPSTQEPFHTLSPKAAHLSRLISMSCSCTSRLITFNLLEFELLSPRLLACSALIYSVLLGTLKRGRGWVHLQDKEQGINAKSILACCYLPLDPEFSEDRACVRSLQGTYKCLVHGSCLVKVRRHHAHSLLCPQYGTR